MNKSAVSVFVKKTAAVAALASMLVLSAPFAALANQTFTVSLSSSEPVAPAHTSQNPIPVTATFSEGVTSFGASNITVSNGSVVNVTASSTSGVYTFGIVSTASGSTTVSIAGDAVTSSADSAHTNSASNQLQFIADVTSTTTATTTPSASSTQAFLTLTNSGNSAPLFSGSSGTAFNAVGTQFWASEPVDVGFDGATSTVSADAGGNIITLLVAGADQSGSSKIIAIGKTSGLVATSSFFVNAAQVLPTGGTTSTGPNAPVVAIVSGPADGSSIGTTSVTFGFTVNDPTATVTCTFGGMFACGSPVILSSLGDSAYTFSVTAASSTGISTSTVNFFVDTVKPVITEVTPVANPNDGTAAKYTFASTEVGTSTLTGGCTVASSAVSVGSNTITFNTLASGSYNCTLSVTDAAGNVSNTLTLPPFTVNAPAAPVTTTSSGGGGGGGGGYVSSGPFSIGYVNNSQGPAPTTGTTGVVLGTSTVSYTFVKPLNIGSRGADVTALQTILIAGGYLQIVAPTGYFGPLTFAAVKAYQGAHGLPQVGNVGPLTRAILNKGQ